MVSTPAVVLSSWILTKIHNRYYTLAHEIAHNLVEVHNSEHEFWFSAICEEHTIQLGHLLSGR